MRQSSIGDTLADWLDDGGQTIDARSLWASHVSLPTTIRSEVLTAILDRDDGAAVHQGNMEGIPDDSAKYSFYRSLVDGTLNAL